MASLTCSLSERPVAMMNGMDCVRGCLRITLSRVSPSTSSMFQSEMMSSTLDLSSLPSASRHELASTISLKPSWLRMYLQMPRMDCWSSTMRTLRALAFGMGLPERNGDGVIPEPWNLSGQRVTNPSTAIPAILCSPLDPHQGGDELARHRFDRGFLDHRAFFEGHLGHAVDQRGFPALAERIGSRFAHELQAPRPVAPHSGEDGAHGHGPHDLGHRGEQHVDAGTMARGLLVLGHTRLELVGG